MGYFKDRAIDIAEFVERNFINGVITYSRDYVYYALRRRYDTDQEVEYGMDIYDEKKGGK